MFSKKKLALLALPLVATLSLQASSPFDDPFFNDPFGDDIFKEMMQMQKEMDKMFDRMHQRRLQRSSALISPLGTYKMAVHSQFIDKGDHYEFPTGIAESKENHIEINTENGRMAITAKIVHNDERKENGMVSKSSSVRMYQQAVSLPNDADESKIQTEYRDGKLFITVAKKKGAAVASVIKVNSVPQQAKQVQSPAVSQPVSTQTPAQTKKDAVKITKEFDQTPAKDVKKEVQSQTKESQSTIKKEVIHSDKHSMI